MNEDIFYCKECINHAGCISVEIDDDGICNHCKNPDKFFVVSISPEMKQEKRKEIKKIMGEIKNNHGNQEFDCVVGFSGGKDSTYLLYLLTVKYNLNVLAVTVITGYMNKIALQNIKQTINRLDVKHLIIEPPIDVFTKLYKWLILNHDSNELPLMKPICDNCTDMIDALVIKEAAKRKIPYVFIGFSPDENARYFFEIPNEKLRHSWIPDHWQSDFFTNDERKWWWDPSEFSEENIPRVILPLHVWSYDEKEIIATVEREELIRKGKADPLKTNCILIWGIGMHDIVRFGHHAYRIQIAKLIRQGLGDRDHWLNVFNTIEPLLAKGDFNKPLIDLFLDKVEMSKEALIELAHSKRQKDPHKKEIDHALKVKGIL
ncbi:MAG: hypothetical protein ACFE8L_04815 [Candidatus Hodarchaeota archaeon]